MGRLKGLVAGWGVTTKILVAVAVLPMVGLAIGLPLTLGAGEHSRSASTSGLTPGASPTSVTPGSLGDGPSTSTTSSRSRHYDDYGGGSERVLAFAVTSAGSAQPDDADHPTERGLRVASAEPSPRGWSAPRRGVR